MKKTLLLLALAACITAGAFAQTKRIEMRSHSGRPGIYPVGGMGWGNPPISMRSQKEIDSINKAWEYRNEQDTILRAAAEKQKADSLKAARVSVKKTVVKKKRKA